MDYGTQKDLALRTLISYGWVARLRGCCSWLSLVPWRDPGKPRPEFRMEVPMGQPSAQNTKKYLCTYLKQITTHKRLK